MIVTLDVRTTLFLGAVVTLTNGLVLLAVMRDFPTRLQPAIARWAQGAMLHPLGYVLLALRDLVPDFVSIVLGNVLLALAQVEYLRAVERLGGLRRVPHVQHAWWVAGAGCAAFTYVWPDLAARVVWVSAVFSVLGMLASRAALGAVGTPRTVSRRVGAAVFAFASVALLLRGAHAVVVGSEGLRVVDVVTSLTWPISVGFPAVASTTFLAMCADAVRRDLERTVATDALTGLPNRRALETLGAASLRRARRAARTCGVVLVDLDRFKEVNDRLGHAAGDEVLVGVAARLRASARGGEFVGRLGGEEFVVILDETDAAGALSAGERMRMALRAAPVPWGKGEVSVRASVGVAVLRDADGGFEDVLSRADRAMYRAKAGGGDRVDAEGA